jgi:uncharacterized protein (TIGR03067 family)
MVRWIISLSAIGLLCGSIGVAQDKPKDDVKLIKGSWDWDPAEKQSDAIPQTEKIVSTEDKMTFHYNFNGKKFTTECTFKLNQDGSPKEIDFTPTEGGNKEKPYPGLYEFKAGQLKICYRGPGATRPKNFDDTHDTKTNLSTVFIYLKRTPAG